MYSKVDMAEVEIVGPARAIVMFGPATASSGMRAGEYFQVTIDPNMATESGDYIRFGLYEGDELNGWQRKAAMTVVELMGASDARFATADHMPPPGYEAMPGSSISMRVIARE